MHCVLLVAVALLLTLLASQGTFVSGQSPPPTPPIAELNSSELCAAFSRRSDELDDVLYSSAGVGAPLDVLRVNWTYVASYLAPNFVWDDYSYLLSRGNYTEYREYWSAVNADHDLYPVVEVPVRDWRSCDPINRRQVSQWRETLSTQADPNKRETSTSIYVVEFAQDSLLITRQAWWNSGNIANLVRPPQPS